MRMRLGAPLLVAVVGLLGAVQTAAAAHCGAASYGCCPQPCCDAQCCFPRLPAAVQDLLQAGLRHRPGEALAHLLPDGPGDRHEAGLQDLLPRTSARPATRPCYADLLQGRATYTVCKPCYKTVLQGSVRDRSASRSTRPATRSATTPSARRCRSAARRSAATPSASRCCETHCHKACHQVCKSSLRAALQGVLLHGLQAGLRDLLQGRLLHDLQAGAARPATRTSAARPATRDVRETCYKDVRQDGLQAGARPEDRQQEVRRVGAPRQYCVPGKTKHRLAADAATSAASTPAPARRTHKKGHWQRLHDAVPRRDLHPQGLEDPHGLRDGALHDLRQGDASARRCPYTVCKKVPLHRRQEGALHGLHDGAARPSSRRCPYTVTRTVTEVVKKQVPYTVTRCCRGAWVDASGVRPSGNGCGNGGAAYDCDGPGRTFVEGAQVVRDRRPTPRRRMVPETVRKKVPVHRRGRPCTEECVKTGALHRLPDGAAHRQEVRALHGLRDGADERASRRCPTPSATMVPYTVCVKVPYTVTECVPTTVCKKVPVQRAARKCA